MNELEAICLRVKSMPQPRWFDLRYKPIMNWYVTKVKSDPDFHHDVQAPLFQMMGMKVFFTIYDGYIYIFTVAKVGEVIDWYRVEKISSSMSLQDGILVSSSDDDPNQDKTVPLLCTMFGVDSAGELYRKMLP